MTHIPNTFYDNFSQPLSQMSFISSCENENDYETTEREREMERADGREKETLIIGWSVQQNVQQTYMNELHSVHGGLKLEC